MVKFDYQELKTNVTALFVAVHFGNLILVDITFFYLCFNILILMQFYVVDVTQLLIVDINNLHKICWYNLVVMCILFFKHVVAQVKSPF